MTTTDIQVTIEDFHQAQAAFRAPDAVATLAQGANVSEEEAAKIVQSVLSAKDQDFFALCEKAAAAGGGRGRLGVGDATGHLAAGITGAQILSLSSNCGHLGRAFSAGWAVGTAIYWGYNQLMY